MNTIQEAQNILRDAESSLRQLMEEALKQQRYKDIAEIATLADGIARLQLKQITQDEKKNTHLSNNFQSSKTQSLKSAPKKAISRSKKDQYPRFVRDGNRLVKIGWSKKNREEYEHRAPREAVIAFARHLANNVKLGDIFVVEDLFPVIDVTTGDEVPAYQVYLTIAWLCTIGVVVKKGRDGYVLHSNSLAEQELEGLWASINLR